MRPNIIVLVPHDVGQFVSPYGIETVDTPACERLASEGVRFSNHFCTTPLCSPARAALFTGRYSHQNGVHGLVMPVTGGFDLADNPGERHLVSLLKQSGYQSVLIGGMHESIHPDRLGFDEHDFDHDIRSVPANMDVWLSKRDKDQPFFMQIGSWAVHRNAQGDGWTDHEVQPDSSKGVWSPPYLQDTEQVRDEMAQMQGSIKRYDTALGQMLDVIDRHGMADNTIFVSTTDHGIDFPRAKGTLYDPGLETIMMIRYPAGGWGEGRVVDALTSHIDLVPTLLEATDTALPDNLAGRSYLPLLEGRDYVDNEYVFAEKTYMDQYDPIRSVRSKRFKYIRHFEVGTVLDPRIYNVPRWRMYKDRHLARELVDELYDLEQDPWEMKNLIRDPEFKDTKIQMRRTLAQWMKDTDDPIIHGHIRSPFFEESMRRLLES